jgi:hypothetical protein
MKEKLLGKILLLDQQISDLREEIDGQDHDFGLYPKKQKLESLLSEKDELLGIISFADRFLKTV